MKSTLTFILIIYSLAVQSQLQKLFDREVMYQHFSGVVLVEANDGSMFKYYHGKKGDESSVEFNTLFDIGSITKQFTAAGILHLVADEKFDLHDRINPLLGKYASDRWDKVTVHQLLTHTSGIPSVYQTEQGLELFFPEEKSLSRTALISRFSDGKLLFSPGEEFSYSNSGYILLAAIIEEASGKNYEAFMQEMFKSYGLSKTYFNPTGDEAKPYYGYRNDLLKKAPIYHHSWFLGAGGVYSTVNDLSKWVGIITSETFLTSDLRKKFLKPHTNSGYGYGWVHNDGIISHDGGNAGFMSRLSFNPKIMEKVIILTNRSFEDLKKYGKSAEYINRLSDKCWAHLNGKDIEVLPEVVESEAPENLRFANGITLERVDTLLMVHVKGNYPTRLVNNTPLEGKDELEKKMIDIANYLEKKKYWSLAKHCDGEMKFVMYSGMMAIGMRMMKKQTGGADEFIPYFVDDSHGLIRMKGPEGILDLIVYFDDEGRIQGMFEHGFYEEDKEVAMITYPIGNRLYFIDGLPYGEKSVTLKITDESLSVYQLNRVLDFRHQPN
ncbi:serine hydrolase domain-containing protein [Ekhidna sp.]|uniref:serine hydrolase domain-containing protein n=1 Tax=Ekhidna sp. TaxID=2608089 RepID=UPI003C7C20CB